jgi:hypothetical protein
LSQTDFKILKYVQTSEQQVCDFYIELLVHRKNDMGWTKPYVRRLITAFCELNWPSFVEMRHKDGNLTAKQFLTNYASGLPISIEGEVTQEVKSIANASGKLTQALVKVVGRHGELKRGYDLLMEDRDILESFPIAKWNDYNMIPFETRYVKQIACLPPYYY